MREFIQKVKNHSAQQAPRPESLLKWYDRHRRAMPWRAAQGVTADPYRVWLSEIMLQQTTVATVGAYFLKFIQRWPTLNALAAADLDDVLRLWAGLGYYRRARLLHQCAQTLRDTHGGIFPQDEQTLKTLPGIGTYTAAAITAIAFNNPANVVDGNVERVMSRIFAIRDPLPQAKAKLREAAATLVPQKRCGDYAQALMDLGATICTPRSPSCDQCPWQKSCQAHAQGIQSTLPRRAKAKPKLARSAVAFVLFDPQGKVFLRRRPPQGLLASMMEIPSSPWLEGSIPSLAQARLHAPIPAKWKQSSGLVTHVFTHFTLEITVATATTDKKLKGHWVHPHKLENEALPSVMKKIVRHALTGL